MPTLALSPVAAAVFTRLNVSAVTTLAPGGVHDRAPQGTPFPFLEYDLQERDIRGLGRGALLEVDLRVSAFSTHQGLSEARAIIAKVIERLKDTTLTVAGYSQAGEVVYHETVPLKDSIVNGVACRELAAHFTVTVEA